ncbi:hypothetical protein Bbelb_250440 [Branchiostoma belcheri]|nr:hypothetical protein Bbelb_250440 [Branchiostoma belcheri]
MAGRRDSDTEMLKRFAQRYEKGKHDLVGKVVRKNRQRKYKECWEKDCFTDGGSDEKAKNDGTHEKTCEVNLSAANTPRRAGCQQECARVSDTDRGQVKPRSRLLPGASDIIPSPFVRARDSCFACGALGPGN